MRLLALSAALALSLTALSIGSTVAHAAPEKETKKSSAMVAVKPGDSLSKIATAKNSTAQRLFDANTDIKDPDLIYAGDEIRVPHKDEELAHRPFPVDQAPVQTPSPAPVTPAPAATPVYRAPAAQSSTAPAVANGSVWDRLAQCESGGNWSINTGNGYYGGLQFSLSSWQAVGGTGLPSDASREEQIMRGQKLQAIQGWGAWPACTAKLGIS